jgi:hypothetical protein
MLDNVITFLVSNDNTVSWNGMENSRGEFMNSATATFTIKDEDGVAVTNAENIVMSYIAGSNGRYEGVSTSNIGLVVGAPYTLEITAYQGNDDAFRKLTVQVLDRTT